MMDYTGIPQELKELNQWVCTWDNAPDTWSSFDQAKGAVESGYYDHVGFVFADNGIVGIDIDQGFEDGLLTPLCADIMQSCHSYTESPRAAEGYISCCGAIFPSLARTI